MLLSTTRSGGSVRVGSATHRQRRPRRAHGIAHQPNPTGNGSYRLAQGESSLPYPHIANTGRGRALHNSVFTTQHSQRAADTLAMSNSRAKQAADGAAPGKARRCRSSAEFAYITAIYCRRAYAFCERQNTLPFSPADRPGLLVFSRSMRRAAGRSGSAATRAWRNKDLAW